jgi:hypothetical protein
MSSEEAVDETRRGGRPRHWHGVAILAVRDCSGRLGEKARK